ncbi:MAG: Endoribonuclease, partial [Gaiellales bacterium]|nr:Endoribonuclease [Gaiellales bacterium]
LRQAFFGESRPASTLVGVRELPVPGMKVEIEAVAVLPERYGRAQQSQA